ncbi:ABC transporter permease [Dactylosporangium sp. NBC_01737]|uniref:ABC transporter permease subunit n=1 Tax=Dactylosporangium sp. NBC_01737 TaxID=2975959 RepID=UPI002E109B2C|nr:ABC transporter permease [Dactylosporangium sp. NBC_01737]
MTPLLRAEWSRLFSRRVTLVTLVLIATLLAFLTFGFTLTRSSPTADEISTAGKRAEAAAVIYDRNVALCEAVQSGTETAPPGVNFPRGCDYGARPTADSMLDFGFSFARQWPALFTTAAIVLTVAGFVLGASFVGVEWSSGGMLNLLLWAPRRGTVLAGKLIAACAGVALVSVVYLTAWTGAFVAVDAVNDTVSVMGFADWMSLLITAVRVALLAMAGTALGFAIASMGRHTSTALGVGIAYLLVYELGAIILFQVIGGVDYSAKYRLSSWVSAWLNKSHTFESTSASCTDTGCTPAETVLSGSWQQAGLVLALVVAVLLAGAFTSMRRRDTN